MDKTTLEAKKEACKVLAPIILDWYCKSVETEKNSPAPASK